MYVRSYTYMYIPDGVPGPDIGCGPAIYVHTYVNYLLSMYVHTYT